MTNGDFCLDCLEKKTSVPRTHVETLFMTITETLAITSGMTVCDDCRTARKAYRLA